MYKTLHYRDFMQPILCGKKAFVNEMYDQANSETKSEVYGQNNGTHNRI